MASNRYNGNVVPFAENATGSNRTVFGDIILSDNIDDNLNDDYKLGWEIVGINDSPTKQDFNALGYTQGKLISHLYQQGISEYNAAQEYYVNSLVMGSNGVVYQSLSGTEGSPNVGNNPITDDANWKLQSGTGAYVIDTIDDFGTVPSGIDTVIVKDNNRGGTFIYDATQSAVNNGGTIFDGWVRQYSGAVNVKWFGAKGDGVTDDYQSFQDAIDYLESIQINNTMVGSSTYVNGGAMLIATKGIYRVNLELSTSIKHLNIQGVGKIVIIGDTTLVKGNSFITADSLRYVTISGIHFQNFNKVFTVSNNNLDLSMWDFENLQCETVNLFIDTVSYNLSRSTSVSFRDCVWQYGTIQIAKIFCDNVTFSNCWIGSSTSSTSLIYANSNLSFYGCEFIPSGTYSSGRSIVYLTSDNGVGGIVLDKNRGVSFNGCRMSNEGGNCPLVVNDFPIVSDVITITPQISFNSCSIVGYSGTPYESGNSESGIVYLKKYPASINFDNCGFISVGGTYSKLVAKSDSLITEPSDFFKIDLDSTSFAGALRCAGELSAYTIAESMRSYINNPDSYLFRNMLEGGHIDCTTTATDGQYKGTFKLTTGYTDSTGATPIVFMLTLGGRGTFSNSDYAYMGASVYIVTVNGYYGASPKSRITYTKLHGDKYGLNLSANSDIVSIHFGTADTGSNEVARSTSYDITIVFGTNIRGPLAKLEPMFNKFSRYGEQPN